MLRQSFAAYNNAVGDQSAGLIVSNMFNATYKKKLHPPITYLISEPTQNCTETTSSAGRFNLQIIANWVLLLNAVDKYIWVETSCI